MSTPPMPMVQVFAPDGTLGDIPYDKLHDAINAGAKVARKVQAPDGTPGYVPADRINDALKAGAKPLPVDLSDADGGKKDGFWQRLTAPTNPAVANSNPVIRGLDAAGGAVLGAIPATYNAVRHPIDTATGLAQSVKGAYQGYTDPHLTAGAVASVLPEALGQGIGNVAGGEAMGAAGGMVPRAVEALPSAGDIGTALRTPEGKLIPPVKVGAKVAGAAAGHALGIPGAGELGGYLVGDKLADMLVPDRPGAATAAERRAVPLSRSPYPENVAQIEAARKAAAQGVPLSELAKATAEPSSVAIVPEPRALFPGETPNYMASVPRSTLADLAAGAKPGAAKQLQQLGQQIIYAPSGAGISGVKASIPLSDLLAAKEPNLIYRARTEGVPEVDLTKPAHATASEEEAQMYAQHRNAGEGQTVSPIDLNNFEPHEYEVSEGPRGNKWYKFKRQLTEDDYE